MGSLIDWQSVSVRVMPAHRVVSGQNGNPRFPGGTLNVGIAPLRYRVVQPRQTFRALQWHLVEPAEFLFSSRGLASWEFVHQFREGDRCTRVGDAGAGPYFWPIGARHIRPFFGPTSSGQSLLGDYDRQWDKFAAAAHGAATSARSARAACMRSRRPCS